MTFLFPLRQSTTARSSKPSVTLGAALAATLPALLVSSCGNSGDGQVQFELTHDDGSIVAGSGSGAAPGSALEGALATKPGGAGLTGGQAYLVDSNQGGVASEFSIVELHWGRLVDVYDTVLAPGVTKGQYLADPLDPDLYESRLVLADFLIGPDVRTEFVAGALKWELSTGPVSGQERLRVGLNVDDRPERFALLLDDATADLALIDPKCPELGGLPPYTAVPRNAAVGVRFDDLVDGTSISASTIRVLAGTQSLAPFDARVIADPNYGGVAAGEFQSTRALVDFTVSADEAALAATPLAVNPLGLPPSASSIEANVAITFPTQIDPPSGQFAVLSNLAGTGLDAAGSGPVDPSSATTDVRWCVRSGNGLEPFGGFLPDLSPPRLLGSRPVDILTAAGGGTIGELRLTLGAADDTCLFEPVRGDVVAAAGGLELEVVDVLSLSPGGPVSVRVEAPPGAPPIDPATLVGAPALYTTYWRASLGADAAPCFVRFTPDAGLPVGGAVGGVAPEAALVARFNEPVDPTSLRPFDSFYIARTDGVDATLAGSETLGTLEAPEPDDLIVGEVVGSAGLVEARFIPSLPLTHESGGAESYFFRLFSAAGDGVVDLAGNSLADAFPGVRFSLDPSAPSADTGGWVLRFNAVDEDGVPGPEVRGQVLFDLDGGSLTPRPVQRFSAVVDRSTPLVSAMQPIAAGLQTPLSSLGSKAHLMWRYADAGFEVSQVDGLFFDLDVEGLALAPLAGQVIATQYDEFEISLGHAANLPDEALDPGSLLPKYPTSGLTNNGTFADSFLNDPAAGPTVVHPRALGFAVSPADVFIAGSGTPMLPLPWNQGLEPEDRTYFTWRDTSIETRGAVNGFSLVGAGAPLEQEVNVLGLPDGPGTVFGPSIGPVGAQTPLGVPAPGLPLLMELSCFPGEALDLTAFDVSIALASSPRPFFRAFSTGGFNTSGQAVAKNPDLETSPTGGFNGNPALGPVGIPTAPRDPSFYLGQMDVVIRVSRAHTVLVDAEQSPFAPEAAANYDYAAAVVEPAPAQQPAGTALVIARRGSNLPSLVGNEALTDANRLDVFGEPIAGSLADALPDNPVFPWVDPSWSETLDDVDGQRFVQSRVTFVSNAATLQTPTLDSLALAFFR